VDVKDLGATTEKGLKKDIKLSGSERRRLERFAELYGAELFVACFLAVMATWVLIPIAAFRERKGGSRAISALDALNVNEMGILGDIAVGVLPPLQVIVHADPAKPSYLDDNTMNFSPGRTEFWTGAGAVTKRGEKEIIRFMMRYGGWVPEQSADVDPTNNRIERLVLTAEPPEDQPEQQWGILGWLSQMYSRFFDSETRNDDGITALDMSIEPGMLTTSIPHDYDSKTLPLLRLVDPTTRENPLSRGEASPA